MFLYLVDTLLMYCNVSESDEYVSVANYPGKFSRKNSDYPKLISSNAFSDEAGLCLIKMLLCSRLFGELFGNSEA